MLSVVASSTLPSLQPSTLLAPGLRTAISHLRREWSRPPLHRIGVEELAAVSLTSRGYLNRLFRLSFGLGPATALEHLRCSRAETLLTRTNLTVEVIAYQCGFADLSHFSHRFSAIHGISPSGYRRAGTQRPSVLDHTGMRKLARLLWA